MKSTNKKMGHFSFDDFEKGLMLAGYVSPTTSVEVEEREILSKYDKEQAKERRKTYFKRAVLAAEIVNEMHDERTFGRVKFQKLVYLCENVCVMNLNERYEKFAAGPFDNKFMHSINGELKKQNWFAVEYRTDGKYKIPVYRKMEGLSKYKDYYNSYFHEDNESIHRIINLFRRDKTRRVELVATIFACLVELKKATEYVSDNEVVEKIYAWSKEKAKYSEEEIIQTFRWMVSQKIIPSS